MRERYLAWTSVSSSAYDRGFTRGMVYHPKRSLSDHRNISCEESRHRVDLRELDLLLRLHSREYPCECLREHSLSTSWWSLHDDIVSACGSDDEGSLRLLLSVNSREVYRPSRAWKR